MKYIKLDKSYVSKFIIKIKEKNGQKQKCLLGYYIVLYGDNENKIHMQTQKKKKIKFEIIKLLIGMNFDEPDETKM